MPGRRLLWHLFPSYLLIVLVALIAVSVYAWFSVRQFYLDDKAADLQARADILAIYVIERLAPLDANALTALCRELGPRASIRITVILPSGKVVADSDSDPAHMDNHANRPEVAAALHGRVGSSVRYSQTVERDMMYVAVPLDSRGTLVGVLRTSVPLVSIQNALSEMSRAIILGLLLAVVLAAGLSLLVARRLIQPLRVLEDGASRFASGDLTHRPRAPRSREMARLAHALNKMASELDKRFHTIEHQRNELESVLAGMVEGVIAVDADDRIITVNAAAAALFNVDPKESVGRTLQEQIRNPDLQKFLEQTTTGEGPAEAEIILPGSTEIFVQTHGTALRDTHGQRTGALLVLHDVTRLKLLERLRRDFVANVSHELRTPLTSIKGFVETLLDGRMCRTEEAARFLGIIAKQVDRLNAIIEDLLSLSRIEEDAEKTRIPLVKSDVRSVLDRALQDCREKANAKEITLTLLCPEALCARINAPLLQQAVVNLVDNAIKYSEPRRSVEIVAESLDNETVITVKDHGCGIAKEHLPRIFERFYRVDKARSRDLGGTGLGLSIVKHITQAHGGRATVESIAGEGSAFSIHLPSC